LFGELPEIGDSSPGAGGPLGGVGLGRFRGDRLLECGQRREFAGVGCDERFDALRMTLDHGTEMLPVEPMLGDLAHIGQIPLAQGGDSQQLAAKRLGGIIEADQRVELDSAATGSRRSPEAPRTTGATSAEGTRTSGEAALLGSLWTALGGPCLPGPTPFRPAFLPTFFP